MEINKVYAHYELPEIDTMDESLQDIFKRFNDNFLSTCKFKLNEEGKICVQFTANTNSRFAIKRLFGEHKEYTLQYTNGKFDKYYCGVFALENPVNDVDDISLDTWYVLDDSLTVLDKDWMLIFWYITHDTKANKFVPREVVMKLLFDINKALEYKFYSSVRDRFIIPDEIPKECIKLIDEFYNKYIDDTSYNKYEVELYLYWVCMAMIAEVNKRIPLGYWEDDEYKLRTIEIDGLDYQLLRPSKTRGYSKLFGIIPFLYYDKYMDSEEFLTGKKGFNGDAYVEYCNKVMYDSDDVEAVIPLATMCSTYSEKMGLSRLCPIFFKTVTNYRYKADFDDFEVDIVINDAFHNIAYDNYSTGCYIKKEHKAKFGEAVLAIMLSTPEELGVSESMWLDTKKEMISVLGKQYKANSNGLSELCDRVKDSLRLFNFGGIGDA